MAATTLLFLALLGIGSAAFIIELGAPTGPQLTLQLVPLLLALQILATSLSLLSAKKSKYARTAWSAQMATTGLAIGLTVAYPFELRHLLQSPHLGLTNMYEVSLLTLSLLGGIALLADTPTRRILPFISPLLLAATLFTWWLTGTGAARPQELVPALQNSILPLHVLANFVGYTCFAAAAGVAAAMLVRLRKDKLGKPTSLPSVGTLEKLAYRLIAVGFPLFSIAILLGCIWAYQAWGGYWSWDPKETWALIVWLMYAAYLHSRPSNKKRPHVLAWWLLAGFAATLFCYLGVNMFLSGLHSYGSLGS